MLPAPTGFQLFDQQGQVLLTWQAVSGAVSYTVNRSPDNVTFTVLASGVTAVQYVDSILPANVGTVYYYTVQAYDGTSLGTATASLAGVALTPGQTTLSNMRLEAQQRCNKENSPFYTTQEWNSMLSQSWKEFYDIIIQKFGDDYYIAPPYTYTTTGTIDPTYQAQVFPLPPDFYKLMRCEVALNPADPNSWITLRQFNAIQANLYNFPNVYTFYGITNLRYRLWGTNLQIVPIASAGQTIRIWYSPRPKQLLNDQDIIDCISGFEEYIVVDACEKALIKEESFDQAQAFTLQKGALLQRITEAAENRNVSEPQTVSDSRTRNFAWGDYGSGGWGQGGYGW